MTNEQMMMGIAILEVNYDNFSISDKPQSLMIWFELLGEEHHEIFMEAIKRYIAKEKFKPTIAGIREQIMLIKNPNSDFTVEQSWKEVQDAIRYCGYYNELEAMARMSPITQSIVRSLGYKYLCTSQDIMADRAHFIQMFNTYKRREEDNLMLPQSLVNETARLKDNMVKLLGENMDMNKII